MLIAAGSELELPGPAAPARPEAVLRFSDPAASPARLPAGEVEIRAARFPSGTLATGAGGPGVAESAMMLRFSSFAVLAAISGAAALADESSWRVFGADIALSGMFGLASMTFGGAMVSEPRSFWVLGSSGAARLSTLRCSILGADGAADN
jgi:hypothetical protein